MNVLVLLLIFSLGGLSYGMTFDKVISSAKTLKAEVISGFGGVCGGITMNMNSCLMNLRSTEERTNNLERTLHRMKGILTRQYGYRIPENVSRRLYRAETLVATISRLAKLKWLEIKNKVLH